MKRLFYLLLVCLLLAGCNSNSDSDDLIDDNPKSDLTNNISVNESNEEVQDLPELKEPVLEWCQLYNPNGFDTVTGIISNPNDVDIDVTYDLVYYKGGIEVARSESFSNFNISPKHNEVIWANVNIPKKEDVDEIKMENVFVSEAYKKSIDAEYSYEGISGHDAIYSFKFATDPEVATVWFLLYNDDNENKKCDENELVVVSSEPTFDKEAKVSYSVDVFEHKNVDIYYNAY